ncbi:MAG: SOS response-associated peptidase [Burkholderiales bacterium]
MCGRYSLHSNPEVVALQFGLDSVPAFAPRYNIAPAAVSLIVKADGAALAHWGLKRSMHNARAETLGVKPSFRKSYHRRRCLVPANGFYEWKRAGALRQPYYLQPAAGELFAFAGLWEQETFTVITTEANVVVGAIHDRMPVIIAPEHYAGWLHGEEGLLRPAPHDAVRCHAVSAAVNGAANESPALIAPLDSEIQKSLFN